MHSSPSDLLAVFYDMLSVFNRGLSPRISLRNSSKSVICAPVCMILNGSDLEYSMIPRFIAISGTDGFRVEVAFELSNTSPWKRSELTRIDLWCQFPKGRTGNPLLLINLLRHGKTTQNVLQNLSRSSHIFQDQPLGSIVELRRRTRIG